MYEEIKIKQHRAARGFMGIAVFVILMIGLIAESVANDKKTLEDNRKWCEERGGKLVVPSSGDIQRCVNKPPPRNSEQIK